MDMKDIVFWQYLISFALVVVMKIVCFVFGYLTIHLGYRLIASGAKGEFKFAASLGSFKGNLVSVSPGLLFVLLGVLLIGYALFVEKGVDMTYNQLNNGKKQERPEPPVPGSFHIGSMEDTNHVQGSSETQSCGSRLLVAHLSDASVFADGRLHGVWRL